MTTPLNPAGGASSPAVPNTRLFPEWQPITVPGISAADQATLVPMAVSKDGPLVAGNQKQLHVFRVDSHPRLWFSIAAHASLSGYALAGGVLYLQDGPVLSVWDVTTAVVSPGQQEATGICLAAINLVTKSQPPPNPSGGGAAGLTDAQYAALFTGASGTPMPAFSAPVARAQQLGGPAGAMVFVLAADGSVYAVDDALTTVTTARYDPPGPLALAMSETADVSDPSQITCTLAYVTKSGGITVIDASGGELKPAGAWPSSGAGQAPVIGPRLAGSTVWACDVFGSAVAACPLPPPTAPAFQAAAASPATAAQDLEVSTTRQLALLHGSELRLLAFAAGTAVADRWPADSVNGTAWAMFWEPPGDPTTQPGLVLTVEKAAATGDVAFAVLVANTVDDPAAVPGSSYPSPPARLVTGTLALAPPSSRRASAVLVCPVIMQEQLFALVADETGAAQLNAWPLQTVAATALPAAVAELQRLDGLIPPVVLFVQLGADADFPSGQRLVIAGLESQGVVVSDGQVTLPSQFWRRTINATWPRFGGGILAAGSVLATPGTQPVLIMLEPHQGSSATPGS